MCKINVVNIHFLDACNYVCHHCFINKENNQLSYSQMTQIVDKIKEYFLEEDIQDGRINLAGGEPLLSNDIDKIIDYIYDKGINVSLITNGYYLTKQFIDRHANQLCCIGISIDSLKIETNRRIGRCQKNGKSLDINVLIDICKYIKKSQIKLKINTCLSKLNYMEDFRSFLSLIKPDRYKVLQMSCDDFDVINRYNRISELEMNEFLKIHNAFNPINEMAIEMEKSYLIIDSKGNITYNNFHNVGKPIFGNKISTIVNELNINRKDFERRYHKNNHCDIIKQ